MSNETAEANVRATIEAMNAALVAEDIATLDRIFAPGYIFTTPIGTTLDKASRLEAVRSGAREISSLSFPELQLQVYGDAAVATSRYIEVVEPQHVEQSGRITNVFVRLDGAWRMVAGQSYSAAVASRSEASA